MSVLPSTLKIQHAFDVIQRGAVSSDWGRAWATLFVVYNEFNPGKELDIRNVHAHPVVFKFIKKYLEFKASHEPADPKLNHHNIHHD